MPMPRSLPTALFEHLLERFPADRDRTRADLREATLPPLVSRLLENLLDRRAERELFLSRSAWFDYRAPGAAAAEDALLHALLPTARIPAEEWESFLEGACYVAVEALVHPVRTLTAYVFDDAAGVAPETLPAETVRERLQSLAAYAYLPEVASAYLDRKGIPALSADGLAELLGKIAQRRVADLGPDEWIRLLDPLFSLAARVPGIAGRVPTETLGAFFRAKGQPALAARVEAAGADALDAEGLREALGRPLPPPPPPLPPPPDFAPRPGPEAGADVSETDVPQTDLPEEPERVAEDESQNETDRSELDPPPTTGDGFTIPPVLSAPPAFEEADAPDDPALDAEAEADEPGSETADEAPAAETEAPAPALDDDRPPSEGPAPLWQQFRRPGRRNAPPSPDGPTPQDDAAAAAPLVAPEPDVPETASQTGVPLWQRFAQPADSEAHESEVEDDDAPIPTTGPAADHPAQPAPTPADPDALAKLEDRVLGPAAQHRDWFVHELFHGDTDAYAQTLHTLTGAATWTEAARTIAAEVFRRHRVDIYSPAAVAFTDAVEACFRSEP